MRGDGRWLTRIPPERSRLVGREDDVSALLASSWGNRLVTVVGPGGIGKTRLALAAAATLERQGEIAGFVELADVAAGSILDALTDQVGVQVVTGASRYDALVHVLAAAPTFLVLDNFEHLIECAPEIADLLKHCPELRVIVTSRRALRLPEEVVLNLGPLPALASDGDEIAPGVQLLLERSGVEASTPAELDAATRVVDGLGGLPLAIELAAPRVRALGFAAVRELLVVALALDGFRHEAAEPSRHSSLRQCLGWTYRDLDERTRAVFRATGVFTGTFDLAALRAVVGDDRRAAIGLAMLVEHNLIDRTEADDGTARYSSIPPIREYARELLASDPDLAPIEHSHAAWYRSVAARIRDTFERIDAERALADFRQEEANIAAAILILYRDGRVAESVAMSCDCAKIGMEFGRETRVNRWFLEVRRVAREKDIALPFEAQIWAAYAELVMHGPPTASDAKAALEDLIVRARDEGDDVAVLRGLDRLVFSVMAHGDLFRGLAASKEATGLARRLGLRWSQAQLSIVHAMGLHVAGDIPNACQYGYEGLRIAREVNASRLVVRVGLLFAPMARTAEMDAEQVPSLETCLEIAAAQRSVIDEMYVVMQLAVLAGFDGDPKVFELARHGFSLADRTRSRGGEIVFTFAVAAAAFKAGDDGVADALDSGLRLSWSALVPVMPSNALERYEQIVAAHRGDAPGPIEATATTSTWAEVVATARKYASSRSPTDTSSPAEPQPVLTRRELDVLREIATGRTNKEAAAALGITPKTVMHHSVAIYRKLGVRTRSEATAVALRSGLVDG